jgi:hypothetical protein
VPVESSAIPQGSVSLDCHRLRQFQAPGGVGVGVMVKVLVGRGVKVEESVGVPVMVGV